MEQSDLRHKAVEIRWGASEVRGQGWAEGQLRRVPRCCTCGERNRGKEIERILNGNSLTSFAYLRQLHI